MTASVALEKVSRWLAPDSRGGDVKKFQRLLL